MRYKEFNPNVVLEKCITLFWNKGYGSCAISDIVEVTGVNRFSLYEAFENKEGMLIAALKLYQERYCTKQLELLVKDIPLKQSLTNFYASFLNENKNRPAGCFIVYTAAELADANKYVKQILDDYIGSIEARFTEILEYDEETRGNSVFYKRQLIGLFCTSISFCLIHNRTERQHLVESGIQVIFDKNRLYATNTEQLLP